MLAGNAAARLLILFSFIGYHSSNRTGLLKYQNNKSLNPKRGGKPRDPEWIGTLPSDL